MIGSEGILGIITQAWMRLQDRPTFRAGGAVRFKDFFAAARAVRAISQAGLYPSNCRILDPPRPTTPARPTARSPSWCWRSSCADHDRRAVDEARARMLRAIMAARRRRAARTRIARARPACGATPSSACPTRWSG